MMVQCGSYTMHTMFTSYMSCFSLCRFVVRSCNCVLPVVVPNIFNSMCPQDGESSKTSEPAAGLGSSQKFPSQLSWCQNLQHTSHTSPLQGDSNRGWQGRCKTKSRWEIRCQVQLWLVVSNVQPAGFQMPGAAKSIKKLDSSELSE